MLTIKQPKVSELLIDWRSWLNMEPKVKLPGSCHNASGVELVFRKEVVKEKSEFVEVLAVRSK